MQGSHWANRGQEVRGQGQILGSYRAILGAEEQVHIVFHRADASDAEVLHQNVGYVGGQEGRQGGSQMDVLHTQVQQGQENDNSLLFIPGNVVHDGQLVHIVQAEDFLQFQGNQSQGVGVVALAGIQYTGNTADVTQVQFVISVFGAASGQDDGILGRASANLV